MGVYALHQVLNSCLVDREAVHVRILASAHGRQVRGCLFRENTIKLVIMDGAFCLRVAMPCGDSTAIASLSLDKFVELLGVLVTGNNVIDITIGNFYFTLVLGFLMELVISLDITVCARVLCLSKCPLFTPGHTFDLSVDPWLAESGRRHLTRIPVFQQASSEFLQYIPQSVDVGVCSILCCEPCGEICYSWLQIFYVHILP